MTTLPARKFIVAADRNNPDESRAHLYEDVGNARQELVPMCEYGWNRSDGTGFSILRGNGSARGLCKLCQKRRMKNLPAVAEPKGHKTQWI